MWRIKSIPVTFSRGINEIPIGMYTNRLLMNSYLKASIVLAIDVLVSLIASICILLVCYVMSSSLINSTRFIIVWLCGALVASGIAFYGTRTYRSIIRYSTLQDLSRFCVAVLCKEAILGLTVVFCGFLLPPFTMLVLLGLDFFVTLAALLVIRVMMLAVYHIFNRRMLEAPSVSRVLVYGTGEKAVAVETRLKNSPHYDVIGFITYGKDHGNKLLAGLPIYSFTNKRNLQTLQENHLVAGILFPYHNDVRAEQSRLIEYCQQIGMKMFVAPGIDEMTDGRINNSGIRKVKIEDLLGRSEIKISMEEIRENFQGKTVMVTGAAGSIGSELCRQLAGLGVKKLVMFDNAETPLHNIRLEFEEKFPHLDFSPVIGDVRLKARLDYVFRTHHPEIVFHAAAYKHVPLMEENPCEAVRVNVIGSRLVADMCVEYGVEKMVMVSTDKAVNPTNIMGCTKRLAEIYVQSLGLAIEKGLKPGKTTFVTTRFGNVLGSNGSVIPRFSEQIEKGGPVTVTDPEIRRFFMTIPEACRLVMEAATMATGTQIFVFDMGTPVKISDLAKKMINLAGYEVDKDIKIEYTGLRPGEKLYEEVLATKENTIPTDHDRIFVAKVRDYGYESAVETVDELDVLSRQVEIPSMVRLMKKVVPEFKSKHSIFEKYDNEQEQ